MLTIDNSVSGGKLEEYVQSMYKNLNILDKSLSSLNDSISHINPVIDRVYQEEYTAWQNLQKKLKEEVGGEANGKTQVQSRNSY